jgi:hypothetical protein
MPATCVTGAHSCHCFAGLGCKADYHASKVETISLATFRCAQRPDGLPITAFEMLRREAVLTWARRRLMAYVAALARWPSGRTRLAVGGYGSAPTLAMDGTEAKGLEVAARNAFQDASDPWGSADYRMDVAAALSRRCLSHLGS